MRRLTWSVGTFAVGMLLLFAGMSPVSAQGQTASGGLQGASSRSVWEQRVLQPASSANRNRNSEWSSYRPGQFGQQVRTVSAQQTQYSSEEPFLVETEPLVSGEGGYYDDCASCGTGAACGEACGSDLCGGDECGTFSRAVGGLIVHMLTNSNYFAGVQGFKGPTDLGRNGNFGFHYGLNWGSPLGDPWGIGYQSGINVVQSNFSGDRITDVFSSDHRDQVFFTSGIFRRAECGGLQWGVVYDLLRDSYRDSATSGQIRTEIAWATPGCREIGFRGTFGVNGDRMQLSLIDQMLNDVDVMPIDVYSVFYRRHFSGGGQGRLWAGVTDRGDAIFGADGAVPLGTSWALENAFTYMVPKQGHAEGGQEREAWNVALRLVWYPGRQAACEIQSPYAPLMMVADNGSMIIDARSR